MKPAFQLAILLMIQATCPAGSPARPVLARWGGAGSPARPVLARWGECLAQVVVDRMAAVVNKRVILESELDQAARVEYLIQGKPLSGGRLSRAELQAVLDQLIDRSLLEQQIVHPDMLAPSPEELDARLREIRKRVPGAGSDEGWKSLLESYGVTEQDLIEHLTSEFRVLRLVDLRFRGLVRIDKSAIAGYYQEKFVPELNRRGAAPPPLGEVSDKIEKILLEQRVDDMLNEWLQTLRSQAHIERMGPAATNTPSGAHP